MLFRSPRQLVAAPSLNGLAEMPIGRGILKIRLYEYECHSKPSDFQWEKNCIRIEMTNSYT